MATIQHAPNDIIAGEDKLRAMYAEYRFLCVLKNIATCVNKSIDSPANAINFVTFICHTYRIYLAPGQKDNIIKLAQYLYQFIEAREYFNTRELVLCMKNAGMRNIDISHNLGFGHRSMVNYYLAQEETHNPRTHLTRWGQLNDVETFLNFYSKFKEALNESRP